MDHSRFLFIIKGEIADNIHHAICKHDDKREQEHTDKRAYKTSRRGGKHGIDHILPHDDRI